MGGWANEYRSSERKWDKTNSSAQKNANMRNIFSLCIVSLHKDNYINNKTTVNIKTHSCSYYVSLALELYFISVVVNGSLSWVLLLVELS